MEHKTRKRNGHERAQNHASKSIVMEPAGASKPIMGRSTATRIRFSVSSKPKRESKRRSKATYRAEAEDDGGGLDAAKKANAREAYGRQEIVNQPTSQPKRTERHASRRKWSWTKDSATFTRGTCSAEDRRKGMIRTGRGVRVA